MPTVEAYRAVVPLVFQTLEQEQQATAAPVLTPLAWAQQQATLVLPDAGRMRFEPWSYQAAILEDHSPRRLILKARQTGISNTCAIEAVHATRTTPDLTVLFVSRNQDLARELIRYCQHTLIGLQDTALRLVLENQGELAWANGSRIVSLPSNPSTGRGIRAGRVYLDEFAFCAYDQLIYESIVPTLSHGGQLTVLSTPNGRANLFYRLWAGIEGGAWSRHEIHWEACPRYTAAWAAEMRATMTRQAFAQEYDCDFVASGDAVFDAEDLARCADGYEPDPAGCTRTVTAWDIGRRHDHTVGVTLGERGETWHLIAYERFLAPYPVIQARVAARYAAFPQGEHYVEAVGLQADAVIDNLDVPVRGVQPYQMTARGKTQAVQALQLLIQQGRLKHQEPQLGRELGLYQWDDKALVQDSVMAAAMAAHAAQRTLPRWGAV